MSNPYAMILEKGSVQGALLTAHQAGQEGIDAAAEALTPEEVEQFESLTIKKLHALGVQAMVYFGGLLYLYRAATSREGRTSLFRNIVEDLGMSDTKAYDAIAIFRVFGRVLLTESDLMSLFPVRSLRLLAAKNVPPEVRNAAIERAREGEYIDIKKAEQLLSEYVSTDEPALKTEQNDEASAEESSVTTVQKSKKSAPFWEYKGDVVRLIVETDSSQTVPNVSVIHDLEAALEAFRREHGDDGVDHNDAA